MSAAPPLLRRPGRDARQRARRSLEEGDRALADGRRDEARACFDRALEADPSCAKALAHRGEANRLAGRMDEALADFDRALDLSPDSAWTLAHRGAAHRMRGHYRTAMADIERALALRPDYPWALGYRCLLHEFLGDFQACLRDFDRTVALCPQLFPDHCSERATLLCQLDRLEEARSWARRAVNEDPDRRLALYTRAVVETRIAGPERAAPHIAAARAAWSAAGPEAGRAITHYRLAGLCALQGRFEEALDLLAQAIDLSAAIREFALLDPAWRDLGRDPGLAARFASLINE